MNPAYFAIADSGIGAVGGWAMPTTDFTENMQARWAEARTPDHGSMFDPRMTELYDDTIAKAKAHGFPDVPNPYYMDAVEFEHALIGGEGNPDMVAAVRAAAPKDYQPGGPFNPYALRDAWAARLDQMLVQARAAHPEIPDPTQFIPQIAQESQAARAHAADVASRATFMGSVGGVVGGTGGTMLRPEQMAMTVMLAPFGGGAGSLAESLVARLLLAAGTDAVLGAAQTGITDFADQQFQQKTFGTSKPNAEIFRDMAYSAAGNALFGFGLQGAGEAAPFVISGVKSATRAAGDALASFGGDTVMPGLRAAASRVQALYPVLPKIGRDAADVLDSKLQILTTGPADDAVAHAANVADSASAVLQGKAPAVANPPRVHIEEADAADLAGSIRRFVDWVKGNKTPRQLRLGKVPQNVVEELRKRGYEVNGFDLVIPDDRVRHALKGHANDQDYPLTAADLERVPEIVDHADIVSVEKTEMGLLGVLFQKRDPSGVTYTVQEIFTGKRRLAFKSMWKTGPGKKGSGGGGATGGEGSPEGAVAPTDAASTTAGQPSIQTSETTPGMGNNIGEAGPVAKPDEGKASRTPTAGEGSKKGSPEGISAQTGTASTAAFDQSSILTSETPPSMGNNIGATSAAAKPSASKAGRIPKPGEGSEKGSPEWTGAPTNAASTTAGQPSVLTSETPPGMGNNIGEADPVAKPATSGATRNPGNGSSGDEAAADADQAGKSFGSNPTERSSAGVASGDFITLSNPGNASHARESGFQDKQSRPPSSAFETRTMTPSQFFGAKKPSGNVTGIGTSKPSIYQAIDDVNKIQQLSRELLTDSKVWLQRTVGGIKGAEVVGVRLKAFDRIEEKLAHRRPDQISDYLGGRVVVEDWAAVDAVVQAIREHASVLGIDDFLVAGKGPDYHALHMQLLTDRGLSWELQIMPREVNAAQDIAHAIYEKWRNKGSHVTRKQMAEQAADKARERQLFRDAWKAFSDHAGPHPESGAPLAQPARGHAVDPRHEVAEPDRLIARQGEDGALDPDYPPDLAGDDGEADPTSGE